MFFGLAGLAIMAVAIAATVASVNTNSTESDLLSQNIEALTQDEDNGKCITENCCYAGGQYCDYECNGGSWSSSNMWNCP